MTVLGLLNGADRVKIKAKCGSKIQNRRSCEQICIKSAVTS